MEHAKNEFIALIDSDNILPSRDWLSRMKNFEKGLSKRFETFSKIEGYAKHTPTLRKPKSRFMNADAACIL